VYIGAIFISRVGDVYRGNIRARVRGVCRVIIASVGGVYMVIIIASVGGVYRGSIKTSV
jgi:hypothetical protein